MTAIAIVGAGMAGVATARNLRRAGYRVSLFDKGRDPGGRMATRRLPGGGCVDVDHGAQFFSAHDPGFAAVLRELQEADAATAWGEAGWSVGTPTMTASVRALAADLDVTTGCTVAKLIRDEAHWRLVDTAGELVGNAFDAVLVTAPTPQACALITTACVERPVSWPALEHVRYAPCWALILAHTGPPAFAETHRRQRDPAAAIAWIARNATKPGRSSACETLVVHAGAHWSRTYLEQSANDVSRLLVEELRALLGDAAPDASRIVHATAHRWRYAMVEESLGEPCLWSAPLRLGVAGDGCLGGRVEAAYLSGTALAEQVCETFG